MRYRRSTCEMGSLDSLLDTVTNVVGILVFVLVVAMLGFRDAIARAGALPSGMEISAEEVALAKDDLERLLSLLGELRSRWGVQEAEQPALLADAEQVNRRIEELRRELARRSHLNADVEALRRELSSLEPQLDALQKRLQEREAYLARLAAERGHNGRHLTLPVLDYNTPEDVTLVTFLLQGGRVYAMDKAGLIERFLDEARRLGVVQGDEMILRRAKELESHFNTNIVGDDAFRLEVEVPQYRGRIGVKVTFVPRAGTGEPMEAILQENSTFKRALQKLDAHKQRVKFHVADDSFKALLMAREIATQAGLQTAWFPHEKTDNVTWWPIPPPGATAIPDGFQKS